MLLRSRPMAIGPGGREMIEHRVKRYRMEIDLRRASWSQPAPVGYDFLPWSPGLLGQHAEVKFRSFSGEVDADVFPCLATLDGCWELMRDISDSAHFLPTATWLAVAYGHSGPEFCGTIQGICADFERGSIQNVGVTSAHRGQGVGTWLICRALQAFRDLHLSAGILEVTAENRRAVALYQRLGFRHIRTLYKTLVFSNP